MINLPKFIFDYLKLKSELLNKYLLLNYPHIWRRNYLLLLANIISCYIFLGLSIIFITLSSKFDKIDFLFIFDISITTILFSALIFTFGFYMFDFSFLKVDGHYLNHRPTFAKLNIPTEYSVISISYLLRVLQYSVFIIIYCVIGNQNNKHSDIQEHLFNVVSFKCYSANLINKEHDDYRLIKSKILSKIDNSIYQCDSSTINNYHELTYSTADTIKLFEKYTKTLGCDVKISNDMASVMGIKCISCNLNNVSDSTVINKLNYYARDALNKTNETPLFLIFLVSTSLCFLLYSDYFESSENLVVYILNSFFGILDKIPRSIYNIFFILLSFFFISYVLNYFNVLHSGLFDKLYNIYSLIFFTIIGLVSGLLILLYPYSYYIFPIFTLYFFTLIILRKKQKYSNIYEPRNDE